MYDFTTCPKDKYQYHSSNSIKQCPVCGWKSLKCEKHEQAHATLDEEKK